MSSNDRSNMCTSTLLLEDNRIFIVHSFNQDKALAALIYNREYIKEISKIIKSTEKIAGIAKTSAEEGQLVEVITPIYEEEEI